MLGFTDRGVNLESPAARNFPFGVYLCRKTIAILFLYVSFEKALSHRPPGCPVQQEFSLNCLLAANAPGRNTRGSVCCDVMAEYLNHFPLMTVKMQVNVCFTQSSSKR